MSKIYITGDTHCDITKIYNISKKYKLTEADYLIVCGDFGYIWNGSWTKNIDKIERVCPATILFIDGNHENFNIIESLPIEEKFGASVHRCGPHTFHLMRGRVYTINGHNFFTFGGAKSTDKHLRTPEKTWWYQEEPTLEEISFGEKTLYDNIDKIEYVLTHECPSVVKRIIYHGLDTFTYSLPAVFDRWIESLYFDAPNFKTWFFGHLHIDETINMFKSRALFDDVVVIED